MKEAASTATKEDFDNQDQSSKDEKEAMAMIARQFKRFLKNKNFDYKKFTKGSSSKMKGNKPLPQNFDDYIT